MLFVLLTLFFACQQDSGQAGGLIVTWGKAWKCRFSDLIQNIWDEAPRTCSFNQLTQVTGFT